jgi:hypothetical protein
VMMDALTRFHHVRPLTPPRLLVHGLQRQLGPVCRTARPRHAATHTQEREFSEQHGSSSSNGDTGSSTTSSTAAAVPEAATATVVTAGSFSEYDAASPLAEQLAGQLVVVTAATSDTGVLTSVATAAGGDSGAAQPASGALPEGLPSPVTVDASLSAPTFGR